MGVVGAALRLQEWSRGTLAAYGTPTRSPNKPNALKNTVLNPVACGSARRKGRLMWRTAFQEWVICFPCHVWNHCINLNSRKRNACIYITSTTDFEKLWPQVLPTHFLKTPAFCIWIHYTRPTRKSRKWLISWIFFLEKAERSRPICFGFRTWKKWFSVTRDTRKFWKIEIWLFRIFFFNPSGSSNAMFD